MSFFTPDILQSFSDEMQKEAAPSAKTLGYGGQALRSLYRGAQSVGKSIKEMGSKGYVKDGDKLWVLGGQKMKGPMTPEKAEFLAEQGRGYLGDIAHETYQSFRHPIKSLQKGFRDIGTRHPAAEEIAKSKWFGEGTVGPDYKFNPDAKGIEGTLRRHGILATVPKYEGKDSWKHIKNVAARALPGRAVTLPMVGMQVAGAASSETASGRKKGVGERALGATGALLPGVRTAGSLGALAPMVAPLLGEIAGKTVGRGADVAASKVLRSSRGSSGRPQIPIPVRGGPPTPVPAENQVSRAG